MSTLGLVGQLAVYDDSNEDLTSYIERLEQYFFANNVPATKQVSVLLSVLGPKILKSLRNLISPTLPKDCTYLDLVKKLNDHFRPTPITIAEERLKFHRRNQTQNENIADYMVELKRLASTCEFGTFLDEALRDRLVCGLRCEAIQKRLLAKKTLTLDDAMDTALAMELADAGASNIKAPGQDVYVNKVNRSSQQSMEGHKEPSEEGACGNQDLSNNLTNMKLSDTKSKPICLVVLGKPGAGKTTVVRKLLLSHIYTSLTGDDLRAILHKQSSVDIDSFNIPFNLFATEFDMVTTHIENTSPQCKYVIFDPPGDVEDFTYSAFGLVNTEVLASSYPTVIIYVMDTVENVSPLSFISSMAVAYTISSFTKIPIVIALNKVDAGSPSSIFEWMKDLTAFQDALEDAPSVGAEVARYLSLTLFKFYSGVRAVGVSATRGDGMSDLMKAVADAVKEYETDFKPDYEQLEKKKQIKYVSEEGEIPKVSIYYVLDLH